MYCIDQTVDEPIMLINKHIGYDETDGQGIDGSLFQQELMQLDALGKKRIQVWINSPGGTVMDGYNIVNAILKSKTPVDTYCVGIAASIAAVIFQQGRKRVMADYGLLMYHNPYGGNGGDELESMRNSIVKMISTRTGKTEAAIREIMARTTWIEAQDALNNGFCDSIELSDDYNRKYVRLSGDTKSRFLECNKVLNSIIDSKKTVNKKSNMKLVTNKLGLNESATEDNILRAIQDIENNAAKESVKLNSELNAANKAKSEAETKASNIEKEYAAAKEKCDALKAELDKMKAEKETAEAKAAKDKAEATETEAKNMLNGFVQTKRIAADAVNGWLEKVTGGKLTVAEVKDMIDALPLNGKAVKFVEPNTPVGDKALTNVVANKMADVRANMEKK